MYWLPFDSCLSPRHRSGRIVHSCIDWSICYALYYRNLVKWNTETNEMDLGVHTHLSVQFFVCVCVCVCAWERESRSKLQTPLPHRGLGCFNSTHMMHILPILKPAHHIRGFSRWLSYPLSLLDISLQIPASIHSVIAFSHSAILWLNKLLKSPGTAICHLAFY